MAAFSFELGFQRALLRLMMRDELFCLLATQHVRPSFFTIEPLGWMFRLFDQHWKGHMQAPTDVVLRNAIIRVPQDRAQAYMLEAESVIACGEVPEHEWLKEQLTDFCRRNMFAIAHEESARLFNAGQVAKAYDVMADAQDRMREVDFAPVSRQWFFEELPERQRKRTARAERGNCFYTGIPELDRATGGVQEGEVWAVFSYAKIGKTTWLANQGYNAIRMQKQRVAHFILEGRDHEVPDRYDALFSNSLYSRVRRGEIDAQRYRELEEEYSYNRGLLVIRTFNDWNVNILAIQGELRELRAHNFVPAMIIVDYADLLRARHRVDSEREHQIEGNRDLKRLANQEGFATWTAWQAKAPKENAGRVPHVLTSASVADAYGKVRIVDAFGSINITDQEKARGEMRVYWEGHRSVDIRKMWLVSNDLSRSRMVTEVVAEAPALKAAE